MSKNDRLSLVREIASRPFRVVARLAAAGMNEAQARRTLRRTCPRLHLNRV